MEQIKGKIRAGKVSGSIGSGVDYYKGETPVKGVDYFTEEDIQEIISRIEVSPSSAPSYSMATSTNMGDWDSGKVVDAATLKYCFSIALAQLGTKAATTDLSTVAYTGDYDDLTDKPSLITETRVNELISAKLGEIENGTY